MDFIHVPTASKNPGTCFSLIRFPTGSRQCATSINANSKSLAQCKAHLCTINCSSLNPEFASKMTDSSDLGSSRNENPAASTMMANSISPAQFDAVFSLKPRNRVRDFLIFPQFTERSEAGTGP